MPRVNLRTNLLLAVAFTAGCGASSTSSPPATASQDAGDASTGSGVTACAAAHTVVLTRHAEKADGSADPSLSAEGKARAERFAKLVSPLGPTHLVATEYKRTQETLEPLAQATKLSIDVQPAKDTDGLANALKTAASGSVTVVAGHSNTVPLVASALGHPIGTIDESEFGRVFVVRFDCSEAGSTLTELRSD